MDYNKDYYSVLGVDKSADEPTIKKAFKKLAKEYHPDMNPGKGTEGKFKEINEAHQVLTSERDKYDQSSQYGKNYNQNFGGGFNPFGRGGQPFDMSGFANMGFDKTLLDEIFRTFNQGQGPTQKQELLDINLQVIVTLADVYNNKLLDVKYTRKIKCPTCKGKGTTSDSGSIKNVVIKDKIKRVYITIDDSTGIYYQFKNGVSENIPEYKIFETELEAQTECDRLNKSCIMGYTT